MMNETTDSQQLPVAEADPEPGAVRLIGTLGVAGFLSGLLLVGVYLFTLPMIQAHKARALRDAVYQVLPGTTAFEPLVMREGRLVPYVEGQEGEQGQAGPAVFAGYNDAGELTGFAVSSAEPGFQDLIAGIFGYQPGEAVIVGFEVLESKETPGLGDKIMKDAAFQAQFERLAVEPQVAAVKKGEKKQSNEVEAITGATISSKAVVRLLTNGLEKWQEAMEEFAEEKEGGGDDEAME